MSFIALQAQFPNLIIPESSVDYEAVNKSYFTAFNNELSPAVILRPKSAEDVSILIEGLIDCDGQCAIRGGGHTPWSGAANIDGGATIDMRGIRGLKLSVDEKTISIGAGERWGDVYRLLEKKGLAVSGGRVSRVGVVGLTLGGGLSYFSGSRGFVCDGVSNFQVVLSSGKIVDANKNSNADLFAALKGGGNNFGIVTRVDISTFEQGKLWGGMILYPGSSIPQLLCALHDFVLLQTPDEHVHLLLSIGYAPAMGGEIGVASLYHAQPDSFKDCPDSLSEFVALQPQLQSSVRVAHLSEFTDEQSSFSVDGGRNLYFTTTILPDLELLMDIRSLFQASLEHVKDVQDLALSIIFQPISQQLLEKSAEAGVNALGLTVEDGPQINVLLNPVWKDKVDDDRIISMCTDFIEQVEKVAANKQKGCPYRFMNYSYSSQKVMSGYGKAGLERLRETSKKYDPAGFFQKNVPGGFKL